MVPIQKMITEIEIHTIAEKEIQLPFFTGYISRAITLNMLRSINPVSAQNMHQPNMIKPYSVTPLYFRSVKKDTNGYVLDINHPCILKIRLFDDDVVKNLVEFLHNNEEILIYDTFFKISSVILKTESLQKISASKSIKINFNSPTYFSKIDSKFNELFPEPEIVFANLMRTYDSIMDEKFGKDYYLQYLDWLKKFMTVSFYNLQTRKFDGKSMRIGFSGTCNYVTNSDNECLLTTNKLAKFAEYSNIGMERTAGFGVVKCESSNNVKSYC